MYMLVSLECNIHINIYVCIFSFILFFPIFLSHIFALLNQNVLQLPALLSVPRACVSVLAIFIDPSTSAH